MSNRDTVAFLSEAMRKLRAKLTTLKPKTGALLWDMIGVSSSEELEEPSPEELEPPAATEELEPPAATEELEPPAATEELEVPAPLEELVVEATLLLDKTVAQVLLVYVA